MLHSHVRSTKAGALAPATRAAPLQRRVPTRTLNEGRSVSSGDTYCIPSLVTRFSALNEGRSVSSGDTRHSRLHRQPAPKPLNEGRSVSSGDTSSSRRISEGSLCAQRRPER